MFLMFLACAMSEAACAVLIFLPVWAFTSLRNVPSKPHAPSLTFAVTFFQARSPSPTGYRGGRNPSPAEAGPRAVRSAPFASYTSSEIRQAPVFEPERVTPNKTLWRS